jgi:hypothetical protein
MTVKELKEELNRYGDDEEVCVVTDNSRYAYDFTFSDNAELTAFWGEDRSIACLYFTEQVGKARRDF